MLPSRTDSGFTLIELRFSGDCSGIICFTSDGTPVPLDGTGGAMAPGCQALR
jgi:hypothetical protein